MQQLKLKTCHKKKHLSYNIIKETILHVIVI